MADITKCHGINCPLKKQCKRYTLKAGEYQSFFVDPPFKKVGETTECKYFCDNKNKNTNGKYKSSKNR